MTFASYYDLSKLNLFILDDNKFMRTILKTMCNALDVGAVKEADSVRTACKILQAFKADVVITDWYLGPPDGLDFVRYLRTGKDTPNPYVPIIMLTGHGEIEHVLAARDAGVNLFMVKPLSAKELYRRLVWIIDNPPPFIRTPTYFGPDRRRENLGPPRGMRERRKDQLIKRD